MPLAEPESALAIGLKEHFENGLYSDLRIKDRKGYEYLAHRVIVCSQSSILANACKPEHGFKEAQTGIIDLENDEPDAVRAMLQFMYHASYEIPDGDSTMLFLVQVYAIGDIYCLREMKNLAAVDFEKEASIGWKKADFTNALRFIYESIPENDRVMRDRAVKVAAKHYKTLLKSPAFDAVLEDCKELGKDILIALSELKPESPKRTTSPKTRLYRCPNSWCNSNVKLRIDLQNSSSESTRCTNCSIPQINGVWRLNRVG